MVTSTRGGSGAGHIVSAPKRKQRLVSAIPQAEGAVRHNRGGQLAQSLQYPDGMMEKSVLSGRGTIQAPAGGIKVKTNGKLNIQTNMKQMSDYN